MITGVHAPISGGLAAAVDNIVKLKCNAMQIFSKNPRGWAAKPLLKEETEEFRRKVKENKIFPVVIHTCYLINLASPDKTLYKKSIDAFTEELERAEELNADYINTHIGVCKDENMKDCLKRISDAVSKALDSSKTTKTILLENTSKTRPYPGGTFEDLADVLKSIGRNTGICFDTCHAYAAGYDIKTEKGLNSCLKEIDGLMGIDKLKVIHTNDSKFDLGSKMDRHEDIGKGKIGIQGFKVIVNSKLLKDKPFILETPKSNFKDDVRNLAVLRKLQK